MRRHFTSRPRQAPQGIGIGLVLAFALILIEPASRGQGSGVGGSGFSTIRTLTPAEVQAVCGAIGHLEQSTIPALEIAVANAVTPELRSRSEADLGDMREVLQTLKNLKPPQSAPGITPSGIRVGEGGSSAGGFTSVELSLTILPVPPGPSVKYGGRTINEEIWIRENEASGTSQARACMLAALLSHEAVRVKSEYCYYELEKDRTPEQRKQNALNKYRAYRAQDVILRGCLGLTEDPGVPEVDREALSQRISDVLRARKDALAEYNALKRSVCP